ncbi:O-antigen transporter [Deinococcus metallilatus]|nr:O-antigen transporter [Deinococcus metallilatus]
MLLRNLVSLYGIQLATLILPLLTLPYLTRVLGPAAWGQLAAVQALAITLSLVVEFGFGYSATRAVAQQRGNTSALARIAAGVLGAKLFLLLSLLLVATIIYALAPAFRQSPALYCWGIVFAAVQGFAPLWYFQGQERLQQAAALDIAGRVVATAGIFLLVRVPEQAWRVLALYAVMIGLAQVINTFRMYRELPFVLPAWTTTVESLRAGFSMFLFRGATSLYLSANSALLRLYLPGAQVGYYANAERLAAAGKSMVQPITQALFPRVSHLVQHDGEAARSLLRRSLLLMLAVSCAAALGLFMAAPWFVPLFFGAAYQPSVPLLQALIVTLPIVAASNVLGLQWMLPNGQDRAFNAIVVAAGLLNIVLVMLLVPRYGSQGMAWSVITTESVITLSMALYILRQPDHPFRKQQLPQAL